MQETSIYRLLSNSGTPNPDWSQVRETVRMDYPAMRQGEDSVETVHRCAVKR